MIQRFILTLISISLFALSARAAMLRVVRIQDARTIVVERGGVEEVVTLGGVEILDDAQARDLLDWTLTSAWVLLERTADGEVLVWRTPDAMFINRELVQRGFARATSHEIAPRPRLSITYLGQIDPPKVQSKISGSESRTGSGSDRRSRAQPSRRAGAKSSASGTKKAPRGPRARPSGS